jgi:hypothetical protein
MPLFGAICLLATLSCYASLAAASGDAARTHSSSSSTSTTAAAPWTLTLLAPALDSIGARCLDGSPAAFYTRPGRGDDAANWILFFEGGGWCESALNCLERSRTPLGSSSSYPPTTSHWDAHDLLKADCTVNPAFCSHSMVYAPYWCVLYPRLVDSTLLGTCFSL